MNEQPSSVASVPTRSITSPGPSTVPHLFPVARAGRSLGRAWRGQRHGSRYRHASHREAGRDNDAECIPGDAEGAGQGVGDLPVLSYPRRLTSAHRAGRRAVHHERFRRDRERRLGRHAERSLADQRSARDGQLRRRADGRGGAARHGLGGMVTGTRRSPGPRQPKRARPGVLVSLLGADGRPRQPDLPGAGFYAGTAGQRLHDGAGHGQQGDCGAGGDRAEPGRGATRRDREILRDKVTALARRGPAGW